MINPRVDVNVLFYKGLNLITQNCSSGRELKGYVYVVEMESNPVEKKILFMLQFDCLCHENNNRNYETEKFAFVMIYIRIAVFTYHEK